MQPTAPHLAKNHKLVYEIVREAGHGTHLTMNDIHALASARRPGIGFTTVYRAIARLRDGGMVSEITLPGADSAIYEPSGPAHAHFRCNRCGQVTDVAYAMPQNIAADLAAQHHIDVETVVVSLHGLCATCR